MNSAEHRSHVTPYIPFIFAGLFLFSLVPWFIFQMDRFMQADAIFLSYAAGQILEGYSITETYFDSNPPMCYLIYIPVIMLKTIGLELWQAHFAYVICLIMLGALLSGFILSRISNLDPKYKITAICAYIFSVTIPMALEFGQKDHLIAIALFPFIISQYSLFKSDHTHSRNMALSLLAVATLILFTPFILIKPHYGLLPTAIIFYRWYKKRTITALLKADFFVLAGGVILYGLIIYFSFPEYINVVLKISVDLYVNATSDLYNPAIAMAALFLSACIIVAIFSCTQKAIKERELSLLISSMAILAVIPFHMQGKGFTLHYLPFISIVIISSALASFHLLKGKLHSYHYATLITAIIITIISGFLLKPAADKTHEYFINHPLMHDLGIDHNSQSFFIENNSTNIVYPISIYNNITNASRFSCSWIVSDELANLPPAETKNILTMLGNAIYEDVEKHKPEVILLLNDKNYAGYLTVLNGHPKIAEMLSLYSEPKIFETNLIYFHGSDSQETNSKQTYNLYRRKDIDQ